MVNNSTNINKMNNNNPHSINQHKKAYDIGNLSGSNRFIGSQPSLIDDWVAITYKSHDKNKHSITRTPTSRNVTYQRSYNQNLLKLSIPIMYSKYTFSFAIFSQM